MPTLIFVNGQIKSVLWIEKHFRDGSLVIAANGGIKHLERLGRSPDVIVGDLDSTNIDESAIHRGLRIVQKPAAKDETDMELALLYAIEHSDEEIFVFGAMGGRMDQFLANVMLLAHPGLGDRRVVLMEKGQRAWIIRSGEGIEGEAGDIVSLIPLTKSVEVKETTGLKWPLHNESLWFGESRGISNMLLGRVATVTLSEGLLLCVHLDRAWARQETPSDQAGR